MPSVALSKSAAQSLISQYSGIIESNMNGDYAIDLVIQQLEAKVAQLENLAMDAYSILNIPGNTVEAKETALKTLIKNLQQDTAALNGANLQEIFLKALKQTSGFQLNLEQEYEIMKQILFQSATESLTDSEMATILAREISPAFRGTKIVLDLSSGAARIASGGKKGTFAIDFNKAFSKLSHNAKAQVADYLKSKEAKSKMMTAKLSEERFDNFGLNLTYLVEQVPVEAMLKMGPKERDRVLKLYPQLKDEINHNFTKQIINACPSADKNILLSSIQEVLSKKPLAFFIGGNIEGMTGILGEIQALYYFKSLLGNKAGASASWIGGLNNPHADLLLVEGLKQFGIQVKNTSRSQAELEVSFQSFGAKAGRTIGNFGAIWEYANTDEALSSLNVLNISSSLSEAIQTFLAMEGFNIYYKWCS